jgi:hypothetical protein
MNGDINIIKVFSVSLFPNISGTQNDIFQEKRTSPSTRSCSNPITERKIHVPVDTHNIPAAFTESAAKEKVITVFSLLQTNHTVGVSYWAFPPGQHITCVQPIHHQQPRKYFMFHLAFCLPYERNTW